jgi:hypothetical protein
MKKLILLTLFNLSFIVSCSAQELPPHDKENIISCYYKHDKNITLIYEKSNLAKINIYGVDQYQIIDIFGNKRMFNEFEFADFICDKPKFPVIIIPE